MTMKLLGNWKEILLHSWSVRLAALGVALPIVLQVMADNIDSMPFIDGGTKSIIRMACLILIPIARVIHQPAIPPAPPEAPNDLAPTA